MTAKQLAETCRVIGAHLSYSMSYYMDWALNKIKPNIRMLRGSDRTSIDRLTMAPEGRPVISWP